MDDSIVLGQSVHNPSAEFQYPKVPIDAPTHPSSVALIEAWRACEAKGGMRMGRDIPSRALAKLLPSIIISEVEPGWTDARVRVAGSVPVERFGRDITGVKLSELYHDHPDDIALFLASGRRAEETREPVLVRTAVVAGSTELMAFEVVFLPVFAADGITQLAMLGTFRF